MTLLSWLAPPVVGAAIGFVTNDIAIRMLFRPLRAYRVLGVRVPFTPGIIPRRRRELAEGIGRMVSQELITAQTVKAHLRGRPARDGLRSWVSRATARLLDSPLARPAGQGVEETEVGSLVEELLAGLFASPQFPSVVRAALDTAFRSAESTSLQAMVGGADVSRTIARALIRVLPLGGGRAATMSDELIAAVARTAGLAAAPAGRTLERWLGAPEIRPELERRARAILRGALEKLSTLQRLVVRAGQYERRLEQKLPEILDDSMRAIGDALADGATQEAIAEALRATLERRRAEGPGGGTEAQGAEIEALREALASLVAALIRPLVEGTLGESMAVVAGISGATLSEKLAALVVERARRPGSSAALVRAVRGAAGRSLAEGGTSLGELLSVGEAAKRRLDDALADKALDLIEERLGDLLSGFDVKAMVVQRIDGLDVADVEKLLVMVIARHLKWINVFGALLGGLIGLAQVLLNYLV